MKLFNKRAQMCGVIAGFALISAGVNADVISAEANGYGLAADISLLLADVTVAPQGHASGTAPGVFDGSNSVLDFSAFALGLASINATVIEGSASSDVDGFAGIRTTDSMGRVDGLGASVLLSSVLGLDASMIQSNASITGDYGSLNMYGSSNLADVTLSILGATLDVDANAAANTVLFDSLGIRVVLNEQIFGGDGIETAQLEVNAIHISFNDVAAGLGLLNGDIRIGHSFASMTATIPSPGVLACVPAGALLSVRRRRRTL